LRVAGNYRQITIDTLEKFRMKKPRLAIPSAVISVSV
jgi:hypothetical protein